MYGKLKGNRIKRRASHGQTALLVLIGVFAYLLAGNLSDKGIAQKWTTAILATLIIFGFVMYICRQSLVRWSFWVSLIICLGVHIIVVWIFFQYVLSSLRRFSILFWYPVMLVEVFVLLIAIKRIETMLTGKREVTKLSF